MKRKQLLFLWCWITALFLSGNVAAQSSTVVISQVYGGGGNAEATYTHDYIEIFNRGSAPVSLNGLSLQYASATGTGNFGASASQLTELPNISLQPGQYFLIQEAGGTTGSALPSPDFVDATPINLSASGGKVALVTGTASLGCNGSSTACNPTSSARIIDLLGFGSANYFEGAGPTNAPSNTTAVIRALNGCTDTDNNRADFATGSPAPRNSSTSVNPCNTDARTNPSATATVNPATVAPGNAVLFTVTVTPGTKPASSGLAVTGNLTSIGGSASQLLFDNGTNGDATADDNIFSYQTTVANTTTSGSKSIVFAVSDAQARTASATANLTVQNTETITKIHAIQGSGSASPLGGQTITIEGVVVGDFQENDGDAFNTDLDGFYVQEEGSDQDGSPATSEGIFVFTTAAVPNVQAGDVVRITGQVVEFNNLTELTNVSAFVKTGTTTIPTPVTINLPVAAVSELERYEGMLVNFSQPLVISEYFNFDQFGEIVLALPLENLDRPFQPTSYVQPGAEAAAIAEAIQLRRITLDDGRSVQNPDPARHPNGKAFTLDNRFRGGDQVQNTVGILDYRFNLYRIQPTQGATYTSLNPRTATPEEVGGRLKVAAFNVLNYFTTFNENGNRTPLGGEPRGANNAEEFARQRAKIIAAISAINADVVGLIEIQNNADEAIRNLVDGLNEKMGPNTYTYLNTGVIGTDEIRVAFIYKPATVKLVGDFKILTTAIDPRFVDTRNRPALAQTFQEISSGEVLTVSVNHFKSKGSGCGAGDDDAQQGNCNGTRTLAAQALVDWLAQDPTGSKDPDFMIIGDLNAYDEEDPIDAIRAGSDGALGTADDFIDLIEKYQGEFAYSYGFDGQFGYLDYALASKSLTKQTSGATEWHINSDEPNILDYDTSFKKPAQDALYEPNPFRASDHDPAIVGLQLSTPTISFKQSGATVQEGSGAYTVTITASETSSSDQTIMISLNDNELQYGEKQDYVTNPGGASGNFTLTIPAGQTTASFTVTPGKNVTKKKESQPYIDFTIAQVSGSDFKIGNPATFRLTISDKKEVSTCEVATYPNPATHQATIKVENAGVGQATVTLYDQAGNMVLSEKVRSATANLDTTVDVSRFKRGDYILMVTTPNGTLRKHLLLQ